MIYSLGLFSSIWSAIHNAIEQAIRTLFGWLTTLVYDFIVDEYQVFIYISRAEILKDETIQLLYRRVGLILGMFMLFKLTFSLIQFLIEPNKFDDSNKGFAAIIKRTVISIVLLGITPSLFRMALDLQRILIDENVVYKLIVGPSTSGDPESFGKVLASNIYFSFYREAFEGSLGSQMTYVGDTATIIDDDGNETTINIETKEIWDFDKMKEMVESGNKGFNYPRKFLFVRANGNFAIDFDGLFCLATGILVAWLLITYCIQIATRVIQLAYLQLIAPVPILSYITDPDGAFKNWLKQSLTTYLDLFIRLAILYFIILVSREVMDNFSSSESTIIASIGDENIKDSALMWVKIFIIIGLLSFGKRAPELLKELFPNLGGGAASLGFGMKSPKKTLNDIPLASKAIGFAGNALKKGAGYVDRKVHHLPKQRGKFGQAIDKWLPGHAEANKSRNEMKDRHNLEQEGKAIYEASKGKLSANAFSSSEYRESWGKVKNAKDELEQIDKEVEYYRNEIAQGRIDPNNSRYQDAIKRQKAASSRLDAVKQDHENIRKIHAKDARREDAFKYYKDMHGSDNSSSPGRSREEILSNISEMRQANGREQRTGFTDAERQAEAQRRESQRSSNNNEHESELASQSIFSDNDAMRESDARYNQTQNNNNDTRVYQNGDDVGE